MNERKLFYPQAKRIIEFEAVLASFGECYLVGSGVLGVGGVLIADLDYVSFLNPILLANKLLKIYGGRYVILDSSRCYVRLVLPKLIAIDIAPLYQGSISADLARRDFTINAVAATLPSRRPIIDPFRGFIDLKAGLLRQVSPIAFLNDPLRVLRGYRLLAERGLSLEHATEQAMLAAVPRLSQVQPERLHSEIMRTCAGKDWRKAFIAYNNMGIWQALPVSPNIRPDSTQYLRLLNNIEQQKQLPAWEHGVAVFAAALLSSTGIAEQVYLIAKQMRLSRNEAKLLVEIMLAYRKIAQGVANKRQACALLLEYDHAALWAALLSGNQELYEQLTFISQKQVPFSVDGNTIAAYLQREPGAWLKPILTQVHSAIISGEVTDQRAALLLAREVYQFDSTKESAKPEDVDDRSGSI